MKRRVYEWLLIVSTLLLAATAFSQQATDMVRRAGDDIARAEAAKRQFDAVRTERASNWKANPSWGPREETASSQLAEAKLRLQVGTSQNDPIQLTQASAVAMQASQEYEQLIKDLQNWSPPPQDPKPPTSPKPQIPADEPSEEKPNTPDLTGGSGQTKLLISEPPPRPLVKPTPRSPKRSSTPPPDLYAAAGAFFEGEYATAIRLLATMQFHDQRAIAHAHLLRSAAQFAIYHVDGEADQALLEKAVEDARLCREADPDLNPSARFFSPKFVDFFRAKTSKE